MVRKGFCIWLLLWALIWLPMPVFAVKISNLQAKRADKVFDVGAEITIKAPVARTYSAAQAFEEIPDYSPMIKSARILKGQRLASKTRVCILGFCKTIKQVMSYELEPNKRIDMKVIPEKGDLKAGQIHWRFEPKGDEQTRIYFKSRIEPDFWVPPLIGSWAVKKVLRQQINDAAKAIEDMVQESAAEIGTSSNRS